MISAAAMAMRTAPMPDIKNLLVRLSRASERSDPLVFGGREGIIAETQGRTEVLPPTGDWGNTVLIEGAPGAGKTALLREIARQLGAAGIATIVLPDVPQPDDVDATYAELATQLAGVQPSLARTMETGLRREGILPSLAPIGASICRSGQARPWRAREGRMPSLRRPIEANTPRAIAALRGDKPWSAKEKAVVFVDEVQNVVPGNAAAEFLRTLHTQQSIPVLLVCAGLSNSRAALERIGLSRIGTANIVRLGQLPLADAVACVHGTFDLVRKEGLAGTDAALMQWSERLAAASDGWPRHLQNYLRASWLTLLDQDTPSLDTADLDAAIARGDDLRERYYLERIEFAKVPTQVLAALHQRLASGERTDTFSAVELIGEAIDALPHRVRERVRATFKDDGACFEKMLAVGAVATDERGCCISPVPSFSRFVLSQGRQT